MPLIPAFRIVGSFAIDNTVLDLGVMLVFGIPGYLMEENELPVAAAILVPGPMVEQGFMTSMMKAQGSFLDFLGRPIADVPGVVTLVVWARVLISTLRRRLPTQEAEAPA